MDTPADIDLMVPHQANLMINQMVALRTLKLRDDQVYNNIQKYGNTTAGSIPIALNEASKKGLAGERGGSGSPHRIWRWIDLGCKASFAGSVRLQEFISRRLLMLTGKGGRKNRVSAALGLSSSGTGRRVLVAEVDAQRSALAEAFGVQLGYEPVRWHPMCGPATSPFSQQ